MQQACKLCENTNETFALHPEVCDDCARYDWGRWRWRQVSLVGGALGALAAFIWGFAEAGAVQGSPLVAALFTGVLGAVLGWAVAEVVVDRLLNRALLHSPPSDTPGERAREAEKFFYIGVLSAYQGKTRFAFTMWALAQSHGWRRWERLRSDPRLAALSRSAKARAFTPPDA